MDTDRITGAAQELGGSAKDTIGGLTGDAKTQAEGKMDKVSGQAQSMFGQAKDAVRDAASNLDTGRVYEQSSRAGAYVGQQVQDQPLVALLSATMVGVLIGYLAGRSR